MPGITVITPGVALDPTRSPGIACPRATGLGGVIEMVAGDISMVIGVDLLGPARTIPCVTARMAAPKITGTNFTLVFIGFFLDERA